MSSLILEPLNTSTYPCAYQGVYADLEIFVQEPDSSSVEDEWFSEESRTIERNAKGIVKRVLWVLHQQDFLFKLLVFLFLGQSLGAYFFFQ